MLTSCQPDALHQYLARRGFAPNPGNSTWLDLGTGQQIIRVLHEPGETTLLHCLTPRSVCMYGAAFSPGTPDAVITAAIEAALSPPTHLLQADPATPARPPDDSARAKERMTRDDHR